MGDQIGDKVIKNSWGSMLQMAHFNNGISDELRAILDGQGTDTSISLAKDKFKVKPTTADSTDFFIIESLDGTPLLSINSVTKEVTAINQALIIDTTGTAVGDILQYNGTEYVNVNADSLVLDGGVVTPIFDIYNVLGV